MNLQSPVLGFTTLNLLESSTGATTINSGVPIFFGGVLNATTGLVTFNPSANALNLSVNANAVTATVLTLNQPIYFSGPAAITVSSPSPSATNVVVSNITTAGPLFLGGQTTFTNTGSAPLTYSNFILPGNNSIIFNADGTPQAATGYSSTTYTASSGSTTINAANNFVNGQLVLVQGYTYATPAASAATGTSPTSVPAYAGTYSGYNGIFPFAAAPTSSSFTYTTLANLPAFSGTPSATILSSYCHWNECGDEFLWAGLDHQQRGQWFIQLCFGVGGFDHSERLFTADHHQ